MTILYKSWRLSNLFFNFIFMRVLSLFDGMSCGRVALERANIKVDAYYASEIDKYAIQIAQKNYPDTIQLWDIKNLNKTNLPKDIDLLIGWSPCQGFSFAGKQLNFKDERSKLFFEYVRILKLTKPKYFLFENVRMKKEYQDVISKYLWVEPIMINSSLVSAQNRVRLYWTNIPNITQPEDKNIVLADILEDGVTDRSKSYCLDAHYGCGWSVKNYFLKSRRQLIFKDFTILENSKLSVNGLKAVAKVDIAGFESSKRVYDINHKSPTLTANSGGNQWPKILLVWENTKKGYCEIKPWECFDATFLNSKTRRWRAMKEKSNCLTAANYEFMHYTKKWYVRKLTPLECERLQTLPDNYTEGVSNTQRYKMIGNGWTVDVVAWIFGGIV